MLAVAERPRLWQCHCIDPLATYIPVDENEEPIGPETPLPVTTMGVERDGFRRDAVVLNIGMGNEEAGWAGIYLTKIIK